MVGGSGGDPAADDDERLAERRQQFGHGALVRLGGPEWAPIAHARARFDPGSAALIGAHVTMTPPFAGAPSPTALDRLRSIVAARLPVTLVIGGAGRFPGSDVVYLPALSRRVRW